jgi:hypothetical protein
MNEESQVFAFLALILFVLTAVILTPLALRASERKQFWKSIVSATEKGTPIPTELADAFLRGSRNLDVPLPQRDTRRGAVMTAIGIGIALIGLCIYLGGAGDPDVIAPAMGVAAVGAIPGCIGVAYLLLGWLAKREAKDSIDKG